MGDPMIEYRKVTDKAEISRAVRLILRVFTECVAPMFVREGLGYQLTFEHLVDVSEESGLVFRPLSPKAEVRLYLIWNRYQTFTPLAERFLNQVRRDFQAAR